MNPAAMTERLIDAAVYNEEAQGCYVAGARKELNEARAAIEDALSSQSLSLSEAREEIERLKGLVAGIREFPQEPRVVDEAAIKEIILDAMGDLNVDIHFFIDGKDSAASWAAGTILALFDEVAAQRKVLAGEPVAWTFGFIDGEGKPRHGLSFTRPSPAEGYDASPLFGSPIAREDQSDD